MSSNLQDYVIDINGCPLTARLKLMKHLKLLGERVHKSSSAWDDLCSFNEVFLDMESEWSCSISHKPKRDLIPISIEGFIAKFPLFLKVDTTTSPHTDKRNLAFYKESGEPWTEDELDTVRNYYGDTSSRFSMPLETAKRKYIYWKDDSKKDELKVYPWDDQSKPKQLKQVSYESLFTVDIPDKVQTTKQESKPVAQPEPIKLTTKETFMSKLKETASTTVEQNKQALVIASKMEAGRIINKQVLKQLAPHLPFFLQGYAKSPFAPFVAANLVAMVANHTGNSKLTKVSDLMLLGAADSGVATFNLDKIVDDILSNIKLPAGVLDDSDDE